MRPAAVGFALVLAYMGGGKIVFLGWDSFLGRGELGEYPNQSAREYKVLLGLLWPSKCSQYFCGETGTE